MNASSTRYAWFVAALLIPVALLNYLDRQMLAAMKFSLDARHSRYRQRGQLG